MLEGRCLSAFALFCVERELGIGLGVGVLWPMCRDWRTRQHSKVNSLLYHVFPRYTGSNRLSDKLLYLLDHLSSSEKLVLDRVSLCTSVLEHTIYIDSEICLPLPSKCWD